MRLDQFIKLQSLVEKLADVALVDADPATWAAAGLKASEMTQTMRGDAYWSRKMALSTISVLARVQGLIHQTQQLGDAPTPTTPATDAEDEQPNLESEIAQAEKDAARVLARVMGERRS
jgi:hypothetical protein